MLARNLELKVGCGSNALADMRSRLVATNPGPTEPERMRQIDTYYRVPRGRLKLRQIDRLLPDGSDADDPAGRSAELIGYDRPQVSGSRWSTYRVAAVDPRAAPDLHDALALTHEVLVRVVKRRDVVHVGMTRVHFDEVEDLGGFVELETVMGGQDDREATREHEAVISLLGLDHYQPIAGSYSDLLLARGQARGEASIGPQSSVPSS